MASPTESDCHKDPNFAVICSFLDKYGESLGLPLVSYSDLARYLEDNTDSVSRVLIDIHVRLLRRIGKSSVSSDRFEKSIIKFCHHFSEFDAWEVESYGYKHANIKTKLRILKNLLECQFDFNLKFKEKVNESSAEEMRFLPIGRDKEGQAYWYFLDRDLNLLIYKEEQDDEDADTWQLVCSDRQQLEKLVNSLKIGATSEIKEEDDKLSSESRSSKEGSPDREESIVKKEENETLQLKGTENAPKQEPESKVKEEPVERDKEPDSDVTEMPGKKQKLDEDRKLKDEQARDLKLGCKVELNVNIERLSAKRFEKYKKRNGGDKPVEGTLKDRETSANIDPGVEAVKNEQKAGDKDEDKESNGSSGAVASCVDNEQKTVSIKSSNDPNEQDSVSTHNETEATEEKRTEVCLDASKDSEESQSKQDHSPNNTCADDKKEKSEDFDDTSKGKSPADARETTASNGPEKSVKEGSHENEAEQKAASTEKNDEDEKSKEQVNSSDTANEILSADRDCGSISPVSDSNRQSDVVSQSELKENPTSNLIKNIEEGNGQRAINETVPESQTTPAKEESNDGNALALEEKKREFHPDKSENSTDDLLNKDSNDTQKHSNDSQKDSEAEKVAKITQDDQRVNDSSSVKVQESSSLCLEKEKLLKPEGLPEQQTDAHASVKSSEEKEEPKDAEHESDTTKSSPPERNLTSDSKSRDKDVCPDPTQTKLLKDPDKEKPAITDTGTKEMSGQSPHISDVEDDFEETAEDHEIDEDSSIHEQVSGEVKKGGTAEKAELTTSTAGRVPCDEAKSQHTEDFGSLSKKEVQMNEGKLKDAADQSKQTTIEDGQDKTEDCKSKQNVGEESDPSLSNADVQSIETIKALEGEESKGGDTKDREVPLISKPQTNGTIVSDVPTCDTDNHIENAKDKEDMTGKESNGETIVLNAGEAKLSDGTKKGQIAEQDNNIHSSDSKLGKEDGGDNQNIIKRANPPEDPLSEVSEKQILSKTPVVEKSVELSNAPKTASMKDETPPSLPNGLEVRDKTKTVTEEEQDEDNEGSYSQSKAENDKVATTASDGKVVLKAAAITETEKGKEPKEKVKSQESSLNPESSPVEQSAETPPLADVAKTTAEPGEEQTVSSKQSDDVGNECKMEGKEALNKGTEENEKKEEKTKADIEAGAEKTTEDKKSDQVDSKVSEETAESQKEARGSETQRKLKRAAPEPASDEVVDSEPNGKRARPTTRVQKTRGGRNAAARGRATRLASKESESEDSESVAPQAKSRRGGRRGRGRGSRGRGRSNNQTAAKEDTKVEKAAAEDNEEDTSDQAGGKRAKKKKPDSSSEALSEEEVTPAKKGRNQIQCRNSTRGSMAARGSRRGGRGGAKGASASQITTPVPVAVSKEEEGSRRRSARVREMKARRPPTPSSPEEESEPTEEEEDDEEEDSDPDKYFLEASFTPEEESGDEEFTPMGRNFQRQAARTTQDKNEEVINDDTPCVKCGKYNHPEMILLCDKCDAGYHTACLRPPLMVIPDGDWFCPPCEHSMLVEKLFACLQSLDIALKKKDRLMKRQERLAYVGISINNILHGDLPFQVTKKFGGKRRGSLLTEDQEEEEEEEGIQSEASSFYESEEEIPERKFRSERLALRQAEKRSRREKHKRRKPSRAQSPETEVFAKRTCRTRSNVSYQFKEFDELISNAIDDDQPVRKEKPPGRSRGKDMSNILGASDEEDEKIRQRDMESGDPISLPIPVVRRKPKRKLTKLDDSEEEQEDDSEEFKLSEEEDSDATEVEEEEEGDDDDLTEENSDSGDWKPKKTWYNSRNNRTSSRRKKFVVDEDDDDYDSDENASKRRSTRNSIRGRIKYDDWDSEEEEETEAETEEEETSFSDLSSDDSRFARKMKKEREKRRLKEGKKKKADADNEEESEESVSDSSMARKRKMLMKLVKRRRKDESGNEESEGREVSKSRIKLLKSKRKQSSDDSSATVDEDDSDEEESDEPRMKKKNVLRSSDEEDADKPSSEEATPPNQNSEVAENGGSEASGPLKPQQYEDSQSKVDGKRESPMKTVGTGKGKKRGEGANLKSDGANENKDEPVPGKVRRVSGSDKEGTMAEAHQPLEAGKKALPARRTRASSREGAGGEVSAEKKGSAAGNRRSSTDKQTRSGKKKKPPNFLDVPSGGESDEGEAKPQDMSTANTAISKPDQPVSSAQPMPSGAQQPLAGPRFHPQPNQGPQSQAYPPNQHFGNPQGHQFNPAFAHGQMVPPHPHMRPGLSSPPHTMSNVSSAGGHESSPSSMTQMPSHYSAPQAHPGNTVPTATGGMRGPYPRYNSMPPSQIPQGMPPHMMNQALEPGQIPPSMSQSPHIRHPQSMPHQPSHGMGHDPRMAHQQQWGDHRGSGQPPAYGSAPRMPYAHEMVSRQPYYHMRSPPPHSMGGQYLPSMSNPLTSMGQMTRNLSPGMKSPPPRPTGAEGAEEQKAPPPQDVSVKSEVKQEMAEKDREAETASPEKAPAATAKPSGKRAKALSPKSHSEKPSDGEEAGGMSKTQSQSQPGNIQPSQPSSTAPMPYYQQHPYMNSQQGGFYMPQHYRPPPYGGPNQGPMNQMPGMFPPHHNQYMNANHPFPAPQAHQPYQSPPGQQQQQQQQQQQPGMPTNMPPKAVSAQNTPQNNLPGQQSQPGMTPPHTMQPPGMPANPSLPANQQRPVPPHLNVNQQGASGTSADSNMMSAMGAYQQQRPPAGMPPLNPASGPGMMPGGPMRPPAMQHPAGAPHGMPPGSMGPLAGQPYQGGPQQAMQVPPSPATAQAQASHQRPAQGQDSSQGPATGATPHTPQAPVNMSLQQHGNVPNLPPTSQAMEPVTGPGLHGPVPQMRPYYPTQPGAPNLPPPTSEPAAGQQSQEEIAKTHTETQRPVSPSSGSQKTPQEAEATQDQKPTPEALVKEEPKITQQEEPPQKPGYSQGETKTSQTAGGTASQTGQAPAVAAAPPPAMPVSQANDPNTISSPTNRNFPPSSMSQVPPGGQGPPMPYYNPGPYYQPYGNMPPQGQHMHPQGRWGPGMPPYGPPRFGAHGYPPYSMGPEAMNMSMMPGQGMHGSAGVTPHPQSSGNPNAGGPMGTPPHSGQVPNTPPHPGTTQDFHSPREQPAAVRNRRSSSTDSRSNAPPAIGSTPHPEGPPQDLAAISDSSQPQSSPSVTSPSPSFSSSTSVKSEQLTTLVSSPSAMPSSTSLASASASTTVSALPPPQVSSQSLTSTSSSSKLAPSNLAGSTSSSSSSSSSSSDNQPNFQQEVGNNNNNNNNPPAPPPMSMGGPHGGGGWAAGPNMNQPQYSHTMGQMHRMGAHMPGSYPVMPPYAGPQGMMPPQSHNPYMMGLPNPAGQPPNNAGQGQSHGGNFEHYQGHMAPQPPHPMGMHQPPMNYNGSYRPPYVPQGQEHPAMPPRSDFMAVDMQSRPSAPGMTHGNESRPSTQVAPSSTDSQTNEGSTVAPKAKRAKTQKKKDTNPTSSPRGKGTRGRGRGRGGFMIDSLLQARGVGREEDDGEDSGEMKDIVNYVTTDEYIKQQTSS